jgi:hypothetical protein
MLKKNSSTAQGAARRDFGSPRQCIMLQTIKSFVSCANLCGQFREFSGIHRSGGDGGGESFSSLRCELVAVGVGHFLCQAVGSQQLDQARDFGHLLFVGHVGIVREESLAQVAVTETQQHELAPVDHLQQLRVVWVGGIDRPRGTSLPSRALADGAGGFTECFFAVHHGKRLQIPGVRFLADLAAAVQIRHAFTKNSVCLGAVGIRRSLLKTPKVEILVHPDQ